MKVILVEPDYRRNSHYKIQKAQKQNELTKINDESLWYPPLGLMKLSTFHNRRNDNVSFIYGCDEESLQKIHFNPLEWDRIYISTMFTFQWKKTIDTINFYVHLMNGDTSKIIVGGIMASLLSKQLNEKTGINPIKGVINSPAQIGLDGKEDIDKLPPDYSLVNERLYAINDTYYAYTSRGCVNKCEWCGVPEIEGDISYIDIKPIIKEMRILYGDKPRLKLMDNNTLACPQFDQIIKDLLELGYGKGNFTTTKPVRERVIDFNQGLDASYFDKDRMKLLSKLNINPIRIAFDRINEEKDYVKAVKLAKRYNVKNFSNYMLYNFVDTPKDLYDRLMVNIKLNQNFKRRRNKNKASIYSYPMRYAPIHDSRIPTSLSQGNDITESMITNIESWTRNIFWTKRFIRNIEIMKGVAHGAISPTLSLARRTIGENYFRFILNLYMPEELLRFRNKYEKKVYKYEPNRIPGNGDIEEFRKFVLKLLNNDKKGFIIFHNLISQNSKPVIRTYLQTCKETELKKWLKYYLI